METIRLFWIIYLGILIIIAIMFNQRVTFNLNIWMDYWDKIVCEQIEIKKQRDEWIALGNEYLNQYKYYIDMEEWSLYIGLDNQTFKIKSCKKTGKLTQTLELERFDEKIVDIQELSFGYYKRNGCGRWFPTLRIMTNDPVEGCTESLEKIAEYLEDLNEDRSVYIMNKGGD